MRELCNAFVRTAERPSVPEMLLKTIANCAG
jgi:hypothetical protein